MIKLNEKPIVMFSYIGEDKDLQMSRCYVPYDRGFLATALESEFNCSFLFTETTVTNDRDDFINRYVLEDSGIKLLVMFSDTICWRKQENVLINALVAKKLLELNKDINIVIHTSYIDDIKVNEMLKEIDLDNDRLSFLYGGINESYNFVKSFLIEKGYETKLMRNSKWISFSNTDSPYKKGVFNDILLNKNIHHKIKRVSISSSKGCPYGCHFCYRGTSSKKIIYNDANSFYDEILFLIENFDIYEYVLTDDVFTLNKIRLQELKETFYEYIKINPKMKDINLRVYSKIEDIDLETVMVLKDLNVKTVSIGIQTINPNLSHFTGRSVTIDEMKNRFNMITSNGLMLMVSIIHHLPGDTFEWFKETLKFTLDIKPYSIKVNQLLLMPLTSFDEQRFQFGFSTLKFKNFALMVDNSQGLEENYIRNVDNLMRDTINSYDDIVFQYSSSISVYKSDNRTFKEFSL